MILFIKKGGNFLYQALHFKGCSFENQFTNKLIYFVF